MAEASPTKDNHRNSNSKKNKNQSKTHHEQK